MRLGRGGEVAAALLVDALFGEPPEDLHPTVWMGRAISAFEKRALKSKSPRVRRLAGVALASALPTLVYLSVRISLVGTPRPLRGALGATLISTSLSMRGLSRAARAVEHELLEGDLERAQASVGALVGRDTEGLSKAEISRAVVESVAENASDGVIGPMLYGFLFGAPGARPSRPPRSPGSRSPRSRRLGATDRSRRAPTPAGQRQLSRARSVSALAGPTPTEARSGWARSWATAGVPHRRTSGAR
jgi:hypothetical protein